MCGRAAFVSGSPYFLSTVVQTSLNVSLQSDLRFRRILNTGFSKMRIGSWRYLGLVGIVATSYFLAAELGLSLAFAHTNVSPVWPPTGIAIAALLVFGRRLWPAVALGALAANLWTDVSIPVAAGIATGNTLEAIAAYHLLNFRIPFDKSFSTIKSVLRFVLCAVVDQPDD